MTSPSSSRYTVDQRSEINDHLQDEDNSPRRLQDEARLLLASAKQDEGDPTLLRRLPGQRQAQSQGPLLRDHGGHAGLADGQDGREGGLGGPAGASGTVVSHSGSPIAD